MLIVGLGEAGKNIANLFKPHKKTYKILIFDEGEGLPQQSSVEGYDEHPVKITSRGLKHIKKLGLSINHGYDAVVIFLIQREDCNFFKIAKDIDHKYYKAYSENKKKGVKFIAYSCKVNNKKIEVEKKIKIIN